jgi:hypothetical protein
VEACLADAPTASVAGAVRGGIAPHAGWAYSGFTACALYNLLRAQPALETIVIFGAVHTWGVDRPALYGTGAWRTPLGDVRIDEELARAVVAEPTAGVVDDPEAHAEEHSIEVQLPFIRYLFPEARILPVSVPPWAGAPQVGSEIARIARRIGRRAVSLGSTDLTHYGPNYGMAPAGSGAPALAWTHDNDRRVLDLIVVLRLDEIVAEARAHHNSCGAGAVAAAAAFAVELGATEGALLHYTTSYEVRPTGRATDMVGYGAVAFVESP